MHRGFRILFLCPYLPSHIRVRPYNFVRVLAERGHEVTLVALRPPGESIFALGELRRWCRAVHLLRLSRPRTLLNGARGFLSELPVQATYSRAPAHARRLRELLAGEPFDVAHVEHLRGVVLAEGLGDLPVVFDTVDSIALLLEKTLRGGPTLKSRLMARLDLARTRRFESRLTRRFVCTAVSSERDREHLIGLGNDPRGLYYVPSCVDTGYYHPMDLERAPRLLTFTGKMSYHANIAAVLDLVAQVMPRVWVREPEARVQIVGQDPPALIRALGRDPRVTVTGFVPDVRPYLARSAVAVSYLRYGVGLTNKVIQAMAMGTPVVATPHAVSTLGATDGEHVLVGEGPEAFADQIVALLRSEKRRAEVGEAGRRYVVQHQTWEASVARLEAMYDVVVRSRGQSRTT